MFKCDGVLCKVVLVQKCCVKLCWHNGDLFIVMLLQKLVVESYDRMVLCNSKLLGIVYICEVRLMDVVLCDS